MLAKLIINNSRAYGKFLHLQDKGNLILFGDAASASYIINNGGNMTINQFVFGTGGKGVNSLIVKNGGMVNYDATGTGIYDDNGFVSNDNNLYMDGPGIFPFTSTAIPAMLNKHRLDFEKIDYFVFQQANKYMLNYIRKKIAIPDEKFLMYIKN